jgi:hypothetical protein
MMGRLMNGWQRIWFVLTCLLLVGVVIYSFVETNKYGRTIADDNYRRRVEADLANPQCKLYAEKPFVELTEPPYDPYKRTCFSLYNLRQGKFKDTVPFTLATYEKDLVARRWEQFLTAIYILGFLSVVLSGLTYFAGWVVAWIRRGFAA